MRIRILRPLATLALLCWTLSTPASAVAADSILWDSSLLRGDVEGSFELHAARLANGDYPTLPGFDDSALWQEVIEELELYFFDQMVAGVQDNPRARAALASFLKRPHTPRVTEIARHLHAKYEWRCGNFAAARNQWRDQGFLYDWYLIGPFENERGSNFGVQLSPELGVDLTETLQGKRNEVSWRRWSELGRAGALELHKLLRPRQEALAYLCTHVYSDQARDLTLRMGTNGAYAIWINETEVGRRDVERGSGFDQDCIPVRLSQGWNQILIKTAATPNSWRVRARLTEDDGTPVLHHVAKGQSPLEFPLAHVAQLPPGTELPGAEKRSQAVVWKSPIERFEEAARALPPSSRATAHRLLGYWLQAMGAHDRSEHPDRKHFQTAVKLEPNSAVSYWLLATTYQQAITHAAQREQNVWRQNLEKALELNPEFHAVRRLLGSYYLDRFLNFTEAERVLKPALTQKPLPPELIAQWSRVLRGRFGSSASYTWDRQQDELLDQFPRLSVRSDRVRSAMSQGRFAVAEALLQRGLAFRASDLELRRLYAELLLRQGKEEATRQQYQFLVEAYPQSSSQWRQLAEFEASGEHWDQALAALARALRVAPQDEELAQYEGELLLMAGRREAAIAALRRSLELDPNRPRLREYIEQLGEATTDTTEEFAIPADEIAEIIARAQTRAEEENISQRILLDNQVVRISHDGTTRRYRQYLVRVLNDQGVRALDYFDVPYSFGEQWVQVTTARVHTSDGDTEDATIRNRDPQVRDGEYPVWSRAWVDLPPLQAGDIVEIEYRIEDLRQSFFGDYFGDHVEFAGLHPVDRFRYTVVAPRDKELFFHEQALPEARTTTKREQETVHSWETRDMVRVDPEPGMPPLREVVPYLQVSTFRDWDEFARWYHHLIRRQFESSEPIRAKVRELTRDAQSDFERVRAIYNYVVQDIRYIAWEFGIHGFKPYNAATIFTRGFGDCKDKSTLICTMLGELGIDAYPVLIYGSRNRYKEDFALPMIRHFNHCIAYVPSLGEQGLFIDGTAEHHSVKELPLMDRGAKVLVVRDDRAQLTEIPWNRPEELAVAERRTVRIQPNGDAELSLQKRASGDFAVAIRSQFEIEGQRASLLERRFSRDFPGTRVSAVEMSSLSNLNEPVQLRIELEVPDYLDVGGEGIKLPSLGDFFGTGGSLAGRTTRSQRNQDLLLGNPYRSDLEVVIELPPGYEVAHMPKAIDLQSPHAQYQFEGEVKSGKLHLRRLIEVRSPRVPVGDYPAFRSFTEELEENRAERILLRKIEEVQ